MSQSSSRAPWILAVSWRGAGKASLPANAREFGSYRDRHASTLGKTHRLGRPFSIGHLQGIQEHVRRTCTTAQRVEQFRLLAGGLRAWRDRRFPITFDVRISSSPVLQR
jgi:hypothetical protein